MATNSESVLEIGHQINELVKQRQFHADMLSTIDATLEKVRGLLGGRGGMVGNGMMPRRRGRPPGSGKKQMAAAMSAGAGAGAGAAGPGRGRGRRRRRRGSFAMSGDESVLSFVQKKGDATTSEIQKHWQSEGRGGKADNSISRLFKDKKLKRTPLENQRGSSYAVA
jgi:hypothetical protein